jgi:hypothetical protein
MRKLRTTAILLITSIMMSLAGCTPQGARKKVRDTVDAYAQAVINGDTDEVARHIEEEQEFKEEIEDYLVRVTGNEDLDDVFDVVLNNITYEIDEDSVEITGKEARIDITYTLIDYEGIYEDYDSAPSIAQYIEALEENTDRTKTIDQEIDLVYTEGEWKIEGDDCDNVTEVYGFYEDLSGYEWSSVAHVTDIEFEAALNSVFGLTSTQYYVSNTSDHTEAVYYDDTAYLAIFIYDDEDVAASHYAGTCSGYTGSSDLSDAFFDAYGPDDISADTEYDGYIILEGEASPSIPLDGPLYGGIYLSGDTVVYALVNEDGLDRLDTLYDFLEELGLPTT